MNKNERVVAKKDMLRICCLPVAGPENPYQHLMMEGLRSNKGLEVLHGVDTKLFAALRTALRFRPDVIHYDWIHRYFLRRRPLLTRLHAPIFVLELAFVRYVLGCRIVWTMHNLVTHDGEPSRLEVWVRRQFAKLCDWIRVFDESTTERAVNLLGVERTRFRVVPEGSYVGYYPNTIERTEARGTLGLPQDALVLLYLGQIRPYKGLETLLDDFAKVRRPDWRLVLAGLPLDSAYADAIAKKASSIEGVRVYLEFVPDNELQRYFNASDVVVLPYSSVENSGTAVLAMGFGKPIIAPKMGVLPQRLCRQPKLLYEPSSIVKSLEMLVDIEREALKEMGKRNLTAVQRHEWSDFAQLFQRASFQDARIREGHVV